MNATETIDTELRRLRSQLESDQDASDVLDRAVVETLAAEAVRSEIERLLDEGGYLAGVVLDVVGTTTDIVQLTYCCCWQAGTSHVSLPQSVAALVAVEPHEVLRVKLVSTPSYVDGNFARPSGPLPPALRGLPGMSPQEVAEFYAASNRAFADWRGRSGFPDRLTVEPGGWIGGLTTGSYCSSLLCWERHSEDWD